VSKLYKNYKLYSLIAGWNYEGGPHLLRHTYVSYLKEHFPYEPAKLQYLSGHDSLLALSKYLHIREKALVESVNKIDFFKEDL
jgi:integrase